MRNRKDFSDCENVSCNSEHEHDKKNILEDFKEICINGIENVKQFIHGFICSGNIQIILISVLAVTILSTLCFPVTFLKVVLLVETIAMSIYLVYRLNKEAKNENIIAINQLEDGFEIIQPSSTSLSLNDIIIREPVEELNELLSFIQNPEKFENIGYKPENRILIIGEAGFGKEALIKAFAHDSNLVIVQIHASRFLANEEIFDTLSALANSLNAFILQIDSFETILATSTSDRENPEVIIDKLKVYLACYSNVICFANCEDSSNIENSQPIERLFKKAIVLNIPDNTERVKFLKEFTKNFDLDENIDFENISKNCFGFSIGEIKYLVTTAVGIAHKNNRKKIVQSDFFEAFDSIEYGISNKKHSKESQKVVAYHESGHALIKYIFSGKDSIIRVASATRGNYGGITYNSVDEEKVILTKEDLINEICVIYAGRCAEKIIFNHLSTGASSDIQHATSIISNMVQNYGMSDEIGPLNVAPKVVLMAVLNESPDMLNLISKECIKIAKECEQRTIDLLNQHIDELHTLANYLIEHESITGNEIEELLTTGEVKASQIP